MIKWEPQYGDLVTKSGFFFSWWGYVIGYDGAREEVVIVRAANPQTLFTLSPSEADKRASVWDMAKIRNGRGFTTLQVRNGQPIWHIS